MVAVAFCWNLLDNCVKESNSRQGGPFSNAIALFRYRNQMLDQGKENT